MAAQDCAMCRRVSLPKRCDCITCRSRSFKHRNERRALFKVLLTLLDTQSSRDNNQLMDKEGFRDRETNDHTIEHGGLGEVDQDADERKRQRDDIPFPHGQGSDLSSARALCDKFDLAERAEQAVDRWRKVDGMQDVHFFSSPPLGAADGEVSPGRRFASGKLEFLSGICHAALVAAAARAARLAGYAG